MELQMMILCVIPVIVTSVTILPNGNSPEKKMIADLMAQHSEIKTMTSRPDTIVLNKYLPNRPHKINSTKIGINERYRRLIPYMTFYYANDVATPPTEAQHDEVKSIEVEKAQIIEAGSIEEEREPRIIHYIPRQKNIPRYQGNRLTQHNIASANPTKLYYKEVQPTYYQNSQKFSPNYNPILHFQKVADREREYERFVQKPVKSSASYSTHPRKPIFNTYQNEDENIQYYQAEKDEGPKYKLVPYEQTPPIRVLSNSEEINVYNKHYNVPAQISKEHVYIKPKPIHPQYTYYSSPQYKPRKPPTTISEMYYEKQPIIESGFQPIFSPRQPSTESPQYLEALSKPEKEKIQNIQVVTESIRPELEHTSKKPYYQLVLEEPSYISKPTHNENTKTMSLADLLNSLQINKSIPRPITKENVSASITTLLQVLNALKAQESVLEAPVLSTPKAFVPTEVSINTTPNPIAPPATIRPETQNTDFNEEPYLADVNPPSQHLDEYSSGGSSQQYPLPINSDEEGGTPGRPGIDYPILTVIPQTKFDCKTQRYKGFFADPETRCQVWHYCDLNGGQASFLCPNGTIFSQAGLTCDWWFNVRCASTAQLYVLNESLYKFILPHSPKFPEDYSGPLVDKYLTLKFKEMEEQFKKNKKKTASETTESSDSTEVAENKSEESYNNADDVRNGGVIIASAGSTGNVERLHDK
ncbi:uncharacterized protein LOC126966841 [Leptidea sinapis]|uniref:uncharacterized protein LOC126966841 n=1 Tax=Leptidea sinapis TaxID=189913 RepID=UPI0021C27A60|nr:uncharacterized protein LOC126966841 [Leptidea sinapis]